MVTQIPPVPSGYVRQRPSAVASVELLGPLRPLAESIVGAVDRAASLARALRAEIVQRRYRAEMAGELSVLSNHTLRDIGVNRSGIRSAVLDIERGVDPRAR